MKNPITVQVLIHELKESLKAEVFYLITKSQDPFKALNSTHNIRLVAVHKRINEDYNPENYIQTLINNGDFKPNPLVINLTYAEKKTLIVDWANSRINERHLATMYGQSDAVVRRLVKPFKQIRNADAPRSTIEKKVEKHLQSIKSI